MSASWSEQPLIVAAAGGDAGARESLVRACYPEVKRRVHHELERDFRKRHRWILPLFSTHDIVHEVLAAVVDGLSDTEFAGPEPFFAYLGTLVRHRLLDAVRFHEAERRDGRKQVAAPTSGLGEVAPDAREVTPEFAASLGERAGLVREALAELPERQQRLLELRLLEDCTFPEIKAALGYASDETARQAFHDARLVCS